MTFSVSPMLDLAHTNPETADLMAGYFAAKSAHDAASTAAFFSSDAITYSDAPLGWAMNGKVAIEKAFHAAMPQWRDGRSYPTAIFGGISGGDGSALVAFTNTPGIVGNELLHIIAAVDVRAGKILRWVDYWDSSSIDQAFRAQVRAPTETFPVTFGEDQVVTKPSGKIADASAALQQALASGDASAAASLFDYDASWEDLTLRTHIIGRSAIERYLRGSAAMSPYGLGSRMRHVVGSGNAGGFEWSGAPATDAPSGVTALALTPQGHIARGTTVYDGKLLGADARRKLVELATAA